MKSTQTHKAGEIDVRATGELKTPIGQIRITASDRGILEVAFVDPGASDISSIVGDEKSEAVGGMSKKRTKKGSLEGESKAERAMAWVEMCVKELEEYFAGKKKNFLVSLDPRGSDFQQEVWSALQEIPFGTSTTYGKIASQLGDIAKMRAVGMANGKNPVAIIIPCHRVIGANGELTGYAGGIWRKEWLLRHEGAMPGQSQLSLAFLV